MTLAKKHFYRPREFHALMDGSIGLREIYSRLRSGDIKALRIGKSGRFLIPASELEDWPQRAIGGEVR